jgi:type IV pilus assembly protein PilX
MMASRALAAASRRLRPRAGQRGIVLVIALIVMVALSLAGIALMRSVETSTAVVGNLAFTQAAALPANLAVEEAVAALYENDLITNVNQDLPAQNYYATRQNDEDARGIPEVLTTKAKASSLARVLNPGYGNEVRYVIERMCAPGIPATPSRADLVKYCDMLPPKPSGTTTMETDKIELPRIPLYRLTVRVDGPRNTVSFLQAMLR